MARKKKAELDEEDLHARAEEDPESKKWNNPNSRKNLKQYQDPEESALVPVVESEDDEEAAEREQAESITVGRKLDAKLVRKMIPKRGTLTLDERKRFTDITTSFLSDFKNEEPTASDIDDIFEIAMCTIQDTRLLKAAKSDEGAGALISISKASESLNKRKQKAKENLASRRSDRKAAQLGQGINIVDLAARYDNKQRDAEQKRVQELLDSETTMDAKLKQIVREENF